MSFRSNNKRQDYYNFTFGVPSGATINGIEVSAEGDTSGAYTGTMLEISLSWNGGTSTTTAKSVVDNTGTPGDTTVVIGGSADTWGRTWTDTELNDTNFRLHAKNVKTTGPWNVDHFKVKVYYTTGGGGGGGGSSSSTVSYVHPDHLGSTNVTSDEQMNIRQTLDYMPYGATRIDTGSDVSSREFIGQFFDEASQMSYLNARYYDNPRGQFLSQDPVFLAIGNPALVKQHAQLDQKQLLTDPQLMNSYAYARGNPITLKDPEGKLAFGPILYGVVRIYGALDTLASAYDVVVTNVQYRNEFTPEERSASRAGFLYNLATGGASRFATKAQRVTLDALTTTGDVLDHYFGAQVYGDLNDRGESADSIKKSNSVLQDISRQQNNKSPVQNLNNTGTRSGSGRSQSANSIGNFLNGLRSFVSSLSSYVKGLSTGKDKKQK